MTWCLVQNAGVLCGYGSVGGYGGGDCGRRDAQKHARGNILLLLCKTRQYEEALRRSEEFYRLYPPRRKSSSPYMSPESVEYQLDKARKAFRTKNNSKAQNK